MSDHKSSKSIPSPILRTLNYSDNDLPPSTILPYRRTNSASIPLHLNSGASTSILHTQTISDSQFIELQPQNLLENKIFRKKSSTSDSSTKIANKEDRFGDYDVNDDDGSRDDDPNNEEEHYESHESISDDDVNKSDNNSIYNEDSLRTPIQNKFYYFFEKPRSNWARLFEAISILCIIFTVVMICVVSWPTIYLRETQIYYAYWVPFDIIALIVFTIEYLGRFYASINKWKFFFRPMNLIDLVSIIPFYIQIISKTESHLKFIRVLLLLRVLRLFNVAKFTVGFSITARVFRRSAYQIVMIFIYLMVILLASSALIYYAERGEFVKDDMTWYRKGKDGNLEVSPFQSIVHSFWWSIVTLTTTGYGDAVPVTGPGKLIAALTMTCGILVIALPTSIIGSNFNNEWAIHRRARFQKRLQKTRESISESMSKPRRIKTLQSQNRTMLEALAEIQDRLADINPPRYYRKYKKLEIKHSEALEKITDLENRLDRWKKIAQNLDTFHNDKFVRKNCGGTDAGNANFRENDKSSRQKWKNIPFRHFSTFSQRDVRRFPSVESKESNDKSSHKIKTSLLSPIRTLTKIGHSLTKNNNVSRFTGEIISSPTELRYSFTPIVEKEKSVGRSRSSSASSVKSQTILGSEYVGNDNNRNIEENDDKGSSSDNVEDKNILLPNLSNHTITTQDKHDNSVEENNKNFVNNSSQNEQNTETGGIEIVVDDRE